MEGILTKGQQVATAVVRVAVGSIFLTAGIEKALAAEPFSSVGFLKFATAGTPLFGDAAEKFIYNPTHDFWLGIAGNAAVMSTVNSLVVAGEIAIGVALVLGLFTRFAAIAGVLMMGLFAVAIWDVSHGIVGEQVLIAIVAGYLGVMGAGRYYGLDSILEKAKAVRQAPQLRYVLG